MAARRYCITLVAIMLVGEVVAAVTGRHVRMPMAAGVLVALSVVSHRAPQYRLCGAHVRALLTEALFHADHHVSGAAAHN